MHRDVDDLRVEPVADDRPTPTRRSSSRSVTANNDVGKLVATTAL